jgi:hypothetical protein
MDTVENRREGTSNLFKNPWGGGGSRLSGQNCQGSPIFGFIAFSLSSFSKIRRGRLMPLVCSVIPYYFRNLVTGLDAISKNVTSIFNELINHLFFDQLNEF